MRPVVIIQTDENALEQNEVNKGSGKWSDSGCIFMLLLREFANSMHVKQKTKGGLKDNSKAFHQSTGKGRKGVCVIYVCVYICVHVGTYMFLGEYFSMNT